MIFFKCQLLLFLLTKFLSSHQGIDALWHLFCLLSCLRLCCVTVWSLLYAGWTEDIRSVINYLHQEHPKAPLFIVGTSIGANVLVRIFFACICIWNLNLHMCVSALLLFGWCSSVWWMISFVWSHGLWAVNLNSLHVSGEVPGRGGWKNSNFWCCICLFSLGSSSESAY